MKVYAIPTYSCNLSCQHCSIKDIICNQDHEKFITAIKDFDGQVILFGGEPLTIPFEYFNAILETGKICTMSSNLLLLDADKTQLLKKFNIDVSTSWNPTRFTRNQYCQWLKNIKSLLDMHIYVTILITLTEDLIVGNDIFQVLADLDRLNCEYLKGVKFEPYVVSSEQLVEKCDKWLSNILDYWSFTIKNLIVDEYLYGNMKLCKGIYTIKPNGEIVNDCPTVGENFMLHNCLKCKYNKVCRPCKKQCNCTFFRNFYEKVQQICQ